MLNMSDASAVLTMAARITANAVPTVLPGPWGNAFAHGPTGRDQQQKEYEKIDDEVVIVVELRDGDTLDRLDNEPKGVRNGGYDG